MKHGIGAFFANAFYRLRAELTRLVNNKRSRFVAVNAVFAFVVLCVGLYFEKCFGSDVSGAFISVNLLLLAYITYYRWRGLHSGGVQLIPAFSGLGAPYFRSGARASLCGMSRGTTRGEIAYAALMSIAQQNADILEAMGGVKRLCVDGGATKNRLLMQMQADLLGCEVLRSENSEMSPMGAALMAGTATGFFPKNMSIYGEREAFLPQREAQERQSLRGAWKKAVESIVEI